MKVTVNRDSPIPMHDQLVQQIAILIAAGVLRPGERLPSIRDLARRLDIHPNTVSAVYKALEGYGVVTVRQGSGVRVIEHGRGDDGPPPLSALVEGFLVEARAAGYADAAIARAFEHALSPAPIQRLIVVDPNADFHPLYLYELARWFDFPISAMTLAELADAAEEALAGAAIATSMYHLAAARAAVGPDRRILVFQVSAAEALLASVREIPAGQTLALVSVSATMLRMANDVIGGLRGADLLFIEASPQDPERLRSVARLADVLVTDGPSAAAVRSLTAKPHLTLELLPPASLERLARALPASASRPRPAE